MEENQSDLILPDITEAEHLTANEVDQEHENGEQVNYNNNAFIMI